MWFLFDLNLFCICLWRWYWYRILVIYLKVLNFLIKVYLSWYCYGLFICLIGLKVLLFVSFWLVVILEIWVLYFILRYNFWLRYLLRRVVGLGELIVKYLRRGDGRICKVILSIIWYLFIIVLRGECRFLFNVKKIWVVWVIIILIVWMRVVFLIYLLWSYYGIMLFCK